MSLTPLLDALSADPVVRKVVETARRGDAPLVDVAVSPGARSPLLAALAGDGATPLLAVTATGREAEDLAAALRCFLPADRVADFPSWETLPHERLSPRSDTVGRRLAVLRRLTHPDENDPAYGPLDVVVAPIRAVLQPLVKGLGELAPVHLSAGDERPLEEVVEALAAAAYTRTDLVERRGEFAVRGGILDVFPPDRGAPRPGRVLGRHGRGDPLVQGRRPAQPRDRRARALGAAVPRDPADRRGPRARPRPRRPAARRRRHARQAGRGHRRRGHGVAGARPGRRHGEPAGRPAAGHPRRPVRPRAHPHPRARPRRHERRVPRGELGQRRRRQRRPRRPAGDPRQRVVLGPGRGARSRPDDRPPVVVAHLLRRRRRAGRVHRRRRRPGRAVHHRHLRRGALPRRHAVGGRRHPPVGARRLADPRGHRRPRPGQAGGRGARRARRARPAGGRPADRPRAGRRARHHRLARARASSRPRRASWSSPRPTSPAPPGRARPPRTCAGCPRAGATRSTRCSCAPATSSSTSSTASAGSSR